jgi:hypothetical protein
MRIALFFIAFTLGAGVAAGLAAADATPPHPTDRRISVVVPESAGRHATAPVRVQPISFSATSADRTSRTAAASGWAPGLGEVALAIVASATVGGGLVVRRRVQVPVRA